MMNTDDGPILDYRGRRSPGPDGPRPIAWSRLSRRARVRAGRSSDLARRRPSRWPPLVIGGGATRNTRNTPGLFPATPTSA